MCGILFVKSKNRFSKKEIRDALLKQEWRGPDASGVFQVGEGVYVGHVRLSILDLSHAADQPMRSDCESYTIVFNGEIYNHLEIRNKLNLVCKTNSDTETIIEGFSKIGANIFQYLDGMFSIVIYDNISGDFWVARDQFGIKPLFHYNDGNTEIFSSETISIREIVPCTISEESLQEWKLIRRPVPGFTYYNEIEEILPGSVYKNNQLLYKLVIDSRDESESDFDQSHVNDLLSSSVKAHELSDVRNVCLLSGGVDSSIITALSSSEKAYTVGMPDNNEFMEAKETANQLGKELVQVSLSEEQLVSAWKTLIERKGEPLSVPNEGMIYLVCNAMSSDEKVVLTGEGADEIFFGYDRVFRAAAISGKNMTLDDFMGHYAYTLSNELPERLKDYILALWKDKSDIEFVEDFFLNVHLPGLLRRMDSSSMAASKEARVPFVTKSLVKYMYRRDHSVKISTSASKIPLRECASKLNLYGPLNRPKIGFSTTLKTQNSRIDEYQFFRDFNLEVLGWL